MPDDFAGDDLEHGEPACRVNLRNVPSSPDGMVSEAASARRRMIAPRGVIRV
jgi:hypothetical protein